LGYILVEVSNGASNLDASGAYVGPWVPCKICGSWEMLQSSIQTASAVIY